MKHARKVIKLEGVDRIKFLNDLLTIEVSEDMGLRYGALLSPQGKILTDLFVWDSEAASYVDLPETQFASVIAKLQMYKLRANVSILETTLGVWQVSQDGLVDPRHTSLLMRKYSEDEPRYIITANEYLAVRIENLIPEFGVDFGTNEAYPIEWRFNNMQGIDYKKGCYVGQEIAARMRHKTTLQKTIKRVNIEGVVGNDKTVLHGEKPVGKLLSNYVSQGIAFLKLSAIAENMSAGDAKLTLSD